MQASSSEGVLTTKISEKKKKKKKKRNFQKMSFWHAVYAGFLTPDEYHILLTWFGGLLLVFIMGITLSVYVAPSWLGHTIWVVLLELVHTVIPVYKYFMTFTIDNTMKQCIVFVSLLHCIFCLVFFETVLLADKYNPGSLWLLNFFLCYPGCVYLLIEFFKWKERNFIVQKLDEDGDGNVTVYEFLMYFKALPLLFVIYIMFNIELYLWVNAFVGNIVTIAVIVTGIAYLFTRDWSSNDFFVSPEYMVTGERMIFLTLVITFFVALFSAENPIFPLTIFFLTLMVRQILKIVSKIALANPDTTYFISPYIMPVYSYSPKDGDLIDETPLMSEGFKLMVTGTLYGCVVQVFVYPVNIGVIMSSFFLLLYAAGLATSSTAVPLELGQHCGLLSVDSVKEAATTAQNKHIERRSPLQIELANWVGIGSDNFEIKQLQGLELMKEKTAIQLASDISVEWRSLNFIKGSQSVKSYMEKKAKLDADIKAAQEKIDKAKNKMKEELGENYEDEYEEVVEAHESFEVGFKYGHKKGNNVKTVDSGPNPVKLPGEQFQNLWLQLKAGAYHCLKSVLTTLYNALAALVPVAMKMAETEEIVGFMKGYERHCQSLFTVSDVLAEAIITARGPLAFLGFGGKVHKFLQYSEINPNLELLRQTWILEYDADANCSSYAMLSANLETTQTLLNLTNLETALDHAYKEESRCAIHFVSILLAATNIQVQRELVTFQKFIKDNMWKFESLGIPKMPDNVFKTASSTSLDLPLVGKLEMY